MASSTASGDARPSNALAGRRAVVVGGGIGGLAAALILSQRGAQVTLLERDGSSTSLEPEQAFASWRREGAPQVRHSHVFLGRLRNLLRDKYPDFLAKIIAAGARELRGTERRPPALANFQPEESDEDLVALGCRRVTFECLLRQHVLEQGDVDLLGGVQVVGLLAARGDPPVVAGVRYRAGDKERALYAHLVVDASGRRSKAPEWLEEIGSRRPYEKTRPSGIVYYTRFYRMRPGATELPQTEHPTAGDFDWIKYAVFPADGNTFSVTLAVPLAVQRLKVLSKPAAFDEMVRSIPGLAPWVDADVADPIGDLARPVQAMGGLVNRLRRFVDDAGPLALRFFVIGDAAYCTNPLYGRGCAQGFLHAHFLGEALDDHADDLTAAAVSLDRQSRQEIEPYYRASVLADRDAVRRAEGRQPRRLEDRWRERFFRDGVAVALRCDAVVYRAFLRMMNMLETPEEAFSRPDVLARCLWILYHSDDYKRRYAVPDPPDREAIIARCEAAASVPD